MGHLFLLGLNEGLKPYVFGLIQSAKTNKTKLSIDNMAIALVDHDKRSNLARGEFQYQKHGSQDRQEVEIQEQQQIPKRFG